MNKLNRVSKSKEFTTEEIQCAIDRLKKRKGERQ